MNVFRTFAVLIAALPVMAAGQETGQRQLKIDSANRTLTVSTNDSVTVEPEVAVLHIGFETAPSDAKTAYAEGSRVSNAIRAALKQAQIQVATAVERACGAGPGRGDSGHGDDQRG